MKLQKIKIIKGDEKTIKDDFEIDLKDYTVLVGENNSGKTNFVNALYSQESKNKEVNIIFFEATNVELDKAEEASTGKKSSPFYKLLAEILKKEQINLSRDVVEPINLKLTSITDKLNQQIIFLKKKKTSLKMLDSLAEEAVIKNLIPLKILDQYWAEEKAVNPDEIGQGAQRMIIFALLKYYSEQEQDNEKLNFFIIEEPEIYLHPRLKKEFNSVLCEIAKKENNQVLITTHDPYFVEINNDSQNDKAIKCLKRDESTGFTTEENLLNQIIPNSHNEINYRVFGVCTDSFHNELYGYLQEKKEKYTINEIEEFFLNNGIPFSRKWTKEDKGVVIETLRDKPVTLQTFIRNKIHHSENITMKEQKFSPDELSQSIKEMIGLIET